MLIYLFILFLIFFVLGGVVVFLVLGAINLLNGLQRSKDDKKRKVQITLGVVFLVVFLLMGAAIIFLMNNPGFIRINFM